MANSQTGYSAPLVIGIMAFAVVSFLFLIDTAMNPDGAKKTANTNNAVVTINTNGTVITEYVDQFTNRDSSANTNATADPTAGWKTYTNTTYGFSLQYPPTWSVNDQSYTSKSIQYPYARVSSPLRYDYTGYETLGIYYAVQFSFSTKATATEQGFYLGYKQGDQSVNEANVTDNFRLSSKEYEDALKIVSSARVID